MRLPGFTFAAIVALGAFAVAAFAADPALVSAARAQVGQTTGYDPAYRKLDYPGGDVPPETGVCTDVVIRAFRAAHALDLQRLVHEDMRAHFRLYPQRWGLKGPDRNIDHRRVPNLQTYFERQGWMLPLAAKPAAFEPGDIVTCLVAGNRPHIMLVSDRRDARGVPLVIHNIGAGAQEENALLEFKLTGHYRRPAKTAAKPEPSAAPTP